MSKTLQNLLVGIPALSINGNLTTEVKDIEFDSRKVSAGSLFVAQKGTQVNGHQFIPKVIEMGATAILCEDLPADLADGVTYIQVVDAARTMGLIAANFYDNPSSKLKLVGVTGTNGKTSTVTLLFKLFRQLGYRVGLLSTVQNQIDDDSLKTSIKR